MTATNEESTPEAVQALARADHDFEQGNFRQAGPVYLSLLQVEPMAEAMRAHVNQRIGALRLDPFPFVIGLAALLSIIIAFMWAR